MEGEEMNRHLLYNNTLLKIVSVLFAIITWSMVVSSIDQTATVKVKDVAVNMDNIQSSTVQKLGLNPIDISKEVTADITIEGKRDTVGNIKESDVYLEFDLSGITVPGTYDVPIVAQINAGQEFAQIKKVSPQTVPIKFDRIVPKEFKIQTDVVGISVPSGYMMEEEIVTPSQIIVTGPEIDVSRVDRVVAVANVDETVFQTFSTKTELKLLDRDGNEIKAQYLTMDTTEAEITVPVLKTKIVPTKIDFINVPEDFPIEDLNYDFSEDFIEIAGPVDKIDSIDEILLGYVDLKNLPEKENYKFDVELPSGFINMQNIREVFVEFDLRNFTGTEIAINTINAVNVPPIYNVNIITENLYLNMYGKEDIISNLVSEEIITQVDFSDREIKLGQYQMPVKVGVPTGELVWALGDYQVVVEVTEK